MIFNVAILTLCITILFGLITIEEKIDNIVIPECKNFTYTPETTLSRLKDQESKIKQSEEYMKFYNKLNGGE